MLLGDVFPGRDGRIEVRPGCGNTARENKRRICADLESRLLSSAVWLKKTGIFNLLGLAMASSLLR
jgi:hypothetical protein